MTENNLVDNQGVVGKAQKRFASVRKIVVLSVVNEDKQKIKTMKNLALIASAITTVKAQILIIEENEKSMVDKMEMAYFGSDFEKENDSKIIPLMDELSNLEAVFVAAAADNADKMGLSGSDIRNLPNHLHSKYVEKATQAIVNA